MEQGKVRGREGGQKYKGSSDNNRRGRGRGETQTDNREAQAELWTSRSGNATDRQTNRIGRLRGTGVGGRMAFFFVIVVFCSMRSLAHDRGLCWMRVAVVSCFPHPLDYLPSLTIKPFFGTTSHYSPPPYCLLKPPSLFEANAAKRHWITTSIHDSPAELSFFQRLDRALCSLPNNLEKRAIYARYQGPGRATIVKTD